MRKDLYSMKLLRCGLLTLSFICLGASLPSLAQAPIILSSANAPLVFELPLDASTTQNLSANTAVQLATRAQHMAQSMIYPEWLSDASFSVISRPRQRLAIVVTPKRGNPELSTELLMTLNNAGRRSFKPLHLLFDTVSSFAGTPLQATGPSIAQTAQAENKPDLNVLLAPVIRFEAAPAPTKKPVDTVAAPVTVGMPDMMDFDVKGPRTSPNALHPRSIAAAQAHRPTQAPAAAQSAPALPAASAPPVVPARSAKLIPVPMPESSLDSWLRNWPMLAGGLVIALALLYLLSRALKSWRERRANQVPSTFLEPRPTALAPEESGATNTVFGVSEEEANAMHAKWLREQINKRNN